MTITNPIPMIGSKVRRKTKSISETNIAPDSFAYRLLSMDPRIRMANLLDEQVEIS
jgi:hypothetical protein